MTKLSIYEISYSADFRDNYKKHSHSHMRIEFIAISGSQENALTNVIAKNPNLDSKRFSVTDVIEIKEGYVDMACNDSFDE